MKGALRSSFSHCVQQVRTYDYHHYLCLLELPIPQRKAAFALRAFNVETSRALDVSADPRICLMRLAWWQEAIDRIYSNQLVEHPTAQALASVLSDTKISKRWLTRSIEARILDAQRDPSEMPKNIGDLEKYAEDTVSTLLYTTLQGGGIASAEADHAASHIGKASGLLLLVKSLPYHASRGRLGSYVPLDVAERCGLVVEEGGRRGIKGEFREGLRDAVFEIASAASGHLRKGRQLADRVPAEARKVLLPAVPAEILAENLRRAEFDVFDGRLARGLLGTPHLLYLWKLKFKSWRGKY